MRSGGGTGQVSVMSSLGVQSDRRYGFGYVARSEWMRRRWQRNVAEGILSPVCGTMAYKFGWVARWRRG